jgi:hypothetical protein
VFNNQWVYFVLLMLCRCVRVSHAATPPKEQHLGEMSEENMSKESINFITTCALFRCRLYYHAIKSFSFPIYIVTVPILAVRFVRETHTRGEGGMIWNCKQDIEREREKCFRIMAIRF